MKRDESVGRVRVVALMGSYRKGETIDRAVGEVLAGARGAGAETEKIDLVDRRVEFCWNCRECCREPGRMRGRCVRHADDVDGILAALEGADAVVLGAPVNFGDVNALTRRLLERMVGYAYWPPGQGAPKVRDERVDKPGVVVTSSAAPAVLTRLFARSLGTLRRMARILGARTVGTLVVGLAGGQADRPAARARERARRLGVKLVRAAERSRRRNVPRRVPVGAGVVAPDGGSQAESAGPAAAAPCEADRGADRPAGGATTAARDAGPEAGQFDADSKSFANSP
jgi:multimeric flavodoxin WrbA